MLTILLKFADDMLSGLKAVYRGASIRELHDEAGTRSRITPLFRLLNLASAKRKAKSKLPLDLALISAGMRLKRHQASLIGLKGRRLHEISSEIIFKYDNSKESDGSEVYDDPTAVPEETIKDRVRKNRKIIPDALIAAACKIMFRMSTTDDWRSVLTGPGSKTIEQPPDSKHKGFKAMISIAYDFSVFTDQERYQLAKKIAEIKQEEDSSTDELSDTEDLTLKEEDALEDNEIARKMLDEELSARVKDHQGRLWRFAVPFPWPRSRLNASD